MPNGKEIAPDPKELSGQQEPMHREVASETETSLQILLQKIVGGNTFTPTEKQVDEILAQRAKVIDYVHEDKKIASADSRFYLKMVLVFVLIFAALVLWLDKDIFSQVLSFLAGLFGGGLGGYGFGKLKD